MKETLISNLEFRILLEWENSNKKKDNKFSTNIKLIQKQLQQQ